MGQIVFGIKSEAELIVDALRKANAIVELDFDGTILTANENFLALSGYTVKDIVGQKHAMLFPEEAENTEAYARFWEELRNGNARFAEYRLKTKDDREIWVFGRSNPVFKGDKPHKIFMFSTDVTANRTARAAKASLPPFVARRPLLSLILMATWSMPTTTS